MSYVSFKARLADACASAGVIPAAVARAIRSFRMFGIVAAGALWLTGCGSGNSTLNIPGGTTGGGGGSSSETAVRSAVKVLPTDGSVVLSNVTDSSVTLSGVGVPALSPGAVIVSGQGSGLLRKVVSVTPGEAQTVVQTGAATLEDVFSKADIKIASLPLGVSDFTSMNLAPGVTVAEGDAAADAETRAQTSAKKRAGQAVSKTFTFTIQPVDLSGGGGQVTAQGTVTVTLSLDADIQIDNDGVKYVLFKPTVVGKAKAVLKSTYKTSFTKSLPLATLAGTPITVQVGPVPVVFTPTFSLAINASGSADVGLTLSSSAHVSAETGATYTRGTGWSTTLDWSKDGSFTAGKNLYATLDGNLTPAHVELGLNLYGAATGSIKADYPTINFHLAHEDKSPAGIRFTETASYHAYAGYDVTILGHSLTSYNSGDFINGSDKWVDQFFPDNGSVDLGVQ